MNKTQEPLSEYNERFKYFIQHILPHIDQQLNGTL